MKVQGKPLEDYYSPLCCLEAAFKSSGLNVEFEFNFYPVTNLKYVTITHNGGHKVCVSIEGDSPAQAVKDVAEVVRL